jgi:branched-chain amino acid transport system substrate-binding protein
VLAKKPDAILFRGNVQALVAWLREVWSGEASLDLPVLLAGDDLIFYTGDDLKTVVQLMAPAATFYIVTPFAVDDSLPALKEFAARYQERWSMPPTAAAGLAYDDARLLFEAMRRAQSIDGSKVRAQLAELRLDGLTGPISFDQQHAATRTAFIVKLSASQLQLLQRYPLEDKPTAPP